MKSGDVPWMFILKMFKTSKYRMSKSRFPPQIARTNKESCGRCPAVGATCSVDFLAS